MRIGPDARVRYDEFVGYFSNAPNVSKSYNSRSISRWLFSVPRLLLRRNQKSAAVTTDQYDYVMQDTMTRVSVGMGDGRVSLDQFQKLSVVCRPSF